MGVFSTAPGACHKAVADYVFSRYDLSRGCGGSSG